MRLQNLQNSSLHINQVDIISRLWIRVEKKDTRCIYGLNL